MPSDERKMVTIKKASSPRPSPPEEERERAIMYQMCFEKAASSTRFCPPEEREQVGQAHRLSFHAVVGVRLGG
jgi:hypothetical protein